MKTVWTVLSLLTAALLGSVDCRAADKEAYAHPALLLEPAQLAKPEVAKKFVILDARSRKKYAQGHLPNARWVDREVWAAAFDHGQDADGWGKRIGQLGIGSETKVVVYDDNFTKDAARIWWILRYWGIRDVRLLNGGWKGWESAKNATETTAARFDAVKFDAKARPERVATKEQLLKALAGGKLQIVDARSEKEFCGIEKQNNKRAGAIPGAKQLEWIDLIDKKSHRFKPAAELRKQFDEAGIDLSRPSATYCQSGGRAAVMAFGLELMGANDVSNYYPSWSEWGNASDTPVVPGKTKSKKGP